MTLTPLDWTIIAVYLIGCMSAGIWMRRYVSNVEDFAVAGREMDLNLGIASLAATEMGLVTVMYTAQMGFTHGFAGAVPGVCYCVVMLLVGITGFVIFPLRKAGVITIPELFEKRFGKRVRWLAGLVVVVGGILNMGIFLRLGGEFLMGVAGFDTQAAFHLTWIGRDFSIGYLETVMISLLALVLLYTVLGGMLSVLVTDYLQFLVLGMGLVVTSILVVWNFGWSDIVSGLERAGQAGQTYTESRKAENEAFYARMENVRQQDGAATAEKLKEEWEAERAEQMRRNAAALAENHVLLDTKKPNDPKPLVMEEPFNPFTSFGGMWVFWQVILHIAVVTTWQTSIARVLSARDETTAKKIYRRTSFYLVGRFALPGLWGATAFLYFCARGGLPEGADSMSAMPQFLGQILPMGVIGLLVAAMLAAEMSTDSGYLLTWATVIYNDLIMPCLRKPLSPRAKLLLVRLMVAAIGVFLVFYGLVYELPDLAWDYLAVTGNIYLASVFTLLVGALYWRGANRWGAMTAIVLGAVGPLAFLIVNAIVKDPAKQIPASLAGLSSFALSFAGMIVGSWLARALGHVDDGPNANDPQIEEATT
ncbi:MAG: sodium:solute symporter family protein [Pirellulaceae bacterium]|nr:sodium:solute symporter family protein [Pirellulaceae bacterium]